MKIRIGLDEAGYGPTLGPLLIASTALELPQDAGDDLWEAFGPVIRKGRKGPASSLWVYDSKSVKAVKGGLAQLETAALAFLMTSGDWPDTVGALLARLGVDWSGFAGLPWYEALPDEKLPAHGWKGDICEKAERIKAALAAKGARVIALRARPISARRFNEGIARTDNKAKLHMEEVAEHLAEGLELEPREVPIELWCDKLGGRDRYGPVLGRLVPQRPLIIVEQGAKGSRYRTKYNEDRRSVELRFFQKADQRAMSVALSSMLAKYLRELFVASLNAWFLERKPGIAPTAGYPQDARRFLEEVAEVELGVPRAWLVRER